MRENYLLISTVETRGHFRCIPLLSLFAKRYFPQSWSKSSFANGAQKHTKLNLPRNLILG